MNRSALPALPRVGAVIRHAYLWHAEARRGQRLGLKDRPCVIAFVRPTADGTRVGVVPVTHSAPTDPSAAIAMPALTKVRLGLDAEPSWIVTDEANLFVWPGYDLLDTPGGEPCYGDLPNRLVRAIRESMRARLAAGSMKAVDRDA